MPSRCCSIAHACHQDSERLIGFQGSLAGPTGLTGEVLVWHAGRCDYWGPFVNRAARFANSAAHGGQICAPAAVGHALILALTKQTLSLESEQPLLLVQPDFVPQKMQLRPSVPWMSQGAAHPLRPKRFDDLRPSIDVSLPRRARRVPCLP